MNALLDNLFRTEYGRLHALLVRQLGSHQIALAEDILQETLLRALRLWPIEGTPANPAGWLYQVARNLALDHYRSASRRRVRSLNDYDEDRPLPADVQQALGQTFSLPDSPQAPEALVAESQLGMMFACCAPDIAPEVQIALILNTLGGLGPQEIARAFLLPLETVKKRLVRAKETFRERRLPLSPPPLRPSFRTAWPPCNTAFICCLTKVTAPPWGPNPSARTCATRPCTGLGSWHGSPPYPKPIPWRCWP